MKHPLAKTRGFIKEVRELLINAHAARDTAHLSEGCDCEEGDCGAGTFQFNDLWPRKYIPDAYEIVEEEGVLTVHVFEVDVAHLTSTKKMWAYARLEDELIYNGMAMQITVIDRYGNGRKGSPEAFAVVMEYLDYHVKQPAAVPVSP